MEGDIKINDIVLLCIDNTPRLHWVFSRVLEIHKSKSGWVRSVRLKLPTTTLVSTPSEQNLSPRRRK